MYTYAYTCMYTYAYIYIFDVIFSNIQMTFPEIDGTTKLQLRATSNLSWKTAL